MAPAVIYPVQQSYQLIILEYSYLKNLTSLITLYKIKLLPSWLSYFYDFEIFMVKSLFKSYIGLVVRSVN